MSVRAVILAGILFTFTESSFPQFPAPRLLVPLTITDGVWTVHDTLGCDLSATYCIDGMVDTNLYEEELPNQESAPFDARIIDHRTDTCGPGLGLRLHLQELGPIDTVRLSITPSIVPGFPITLRWSLIYQGLVRWWDLRLGISGDDISTYTDMLSDSVFVITNPSMSTLDIIGSGSPFDDVDSDYGHTPSIPTLYQNYPNPFNPRTTIRYYLPSRSIVTLTICDILGRSVLENRDLDGSPGYHTVEISAVDLSSGVYTYQLKTDSRVLSRRFLYIK